MSTEQGKILQFSELKVINVQELTVNTRKIQAGLIAPAKETVAVLPFSTVTVFGSCATYLSEGVSVTV